MRKAFLSIGIVLLALSAGAQSKEHKLGISLGGGPQDYYGDLGNGFGISSYDVWRGAVVLHADYYISRSFDAKAFGTFGDLGFCQSFDVIQEPIEDDDRCPGCVGRVGLGNLSAHMNSLGVGVKYKLANGYVLKENARIRPYVYGGAAYCSVSDPMKMDCVKTGDYLSINAGAGFKVYLTKRLNVGYNLAFGYYNRDELDFMSHGKGNDMYMQNSLTVGIDIL